MPIPELERRRVERALDAFCDRVPLRVRPELTYEYRFRGNAVMLLERRPHFQDRTRHTEHVFAKFVYSPTVGGWSLKWCDRNAKWHGYKGFDNVPHFREVLREVETDPTGIFLG
jgi:Protein of unknown function (DUF3024)